ncbi:MAG: SufS family cysteine desulfurase [bacterium]|nr:SufS family cysteine desulfurase [bacterium]
MSIFHTMRDNFPILRRTINGEPFIYFDNAATSLKPRAVVEALTGYYEGYSGNVHRGIHTVSTEATEAYEGAREKVAQFINARSSKEIVFVRNATEAINLVAQAYVRGCLGSGGAVILTSEMEHHANLVPWQQLAKHDGVALRFIPVNPKTGLLDLANLDALVQGVRFVALTHVSNVLGTINPIKEIIERAHAAGATVLVDAAQSVPHMAVDVQFLDCDFLVFSGHKMLGPTGIGALYAKRELLEAMPPFLTGGDMIKTVSYEGAEWNDLPWKFEAGTPHIAGAIGLGAAIDYLCAVGMECIRQHEKNLVGYLLEKLEAVEGLTIYGPKDAQLRAGVASFGLDGLHPHDVASLLDEKGIAVRAGYLCAEPLVKKLTGAEPVVRASLYLYNTTAEVDRFVEVLKEISGRFGSFSNHESGIRNYEN